MKNSLLTVSVEVVKKNTENPVQVVKNTTIFNRDFIVYGTIENPLFLAKDVAAFIEHSDVSMMMRNVDDDEKVSLTNPNNVCGGQSAWFLTENGLYEVLMLSRKPIAKAFKSEVKKILKEIRLTGAYSVKTPKTFAEALRLAADQQEEIERQQKLIAENQPKVDYFNEFENSDHLEEIGVVGKILAMNVDVKKFGEKKIFTVLQDDKIIYKRFTADKVPFFVPYQGYEQYFKSTNTKFTHNDKTLYRPNLWLTTKGHIYILKRYSKLSKEQIQHTFETAEFDFGSDN